jgi:hypothetical protein
MLERITSITRFLTGHTSVWPVLGVIGGAWVAGACGGLTNPTPTAHIKTDTLVAWAMNLTQGSLPAGFYLADQNVVQINAGATFDIAFDVDSATRRAVIYPARLVTDGSVATRHAGLQRITIPYDSATYGLRSGYQFDSVYALAPGDAMYLISNPIGCATALNPTLYGKFIIDSVNVVTRTVHFRATTDPNCGFRSFKPGIPSF